MSERHIDKDNKIIVAMDNSIEDGLDLIDKIERNKRISHMVYGYKIGSLWILEQGVEVLADASGEKIIILDMQKWPTDTPEIVTKQVNRIAETQIVYELVACPMGGGVKSLKSFVTACKNNGIRPLCTLEMTPEESDSYLKPLYYMDILKDAASMGVDGFIIPATKEPKMEIKKFLETEFPNLDAEFYTTGYGFQEGQAGQMVKFGVKKFIIGRFIYESKDPEKAIIDAYNDINAGLSL